MNDRVEVLLRAYAKCWTTASTWLTRGPKRLPGPVMAVSLTGLAIPRISHGHRLAAAFRGI